MFWGVVFASRVMGDPEIMISWSSSPSCCVLKCFEQIFGGPGGNSIDASYAFSFVVVLSLRFGPNIFHIVRHRSDDMSVARG